jgi:hypothetical protein
MVMSGSDTHMINLWNLNSICHFIALGLFCYYLFIMFWYFDQLIKAMLSFNLYFVDQPYTLHELPPLVSSCHIISHNLLSDEHV